MRAKFAGVLAFALSIGVSQAAFAADMPVKALAPAIAAPALTPSGYIELYGGGDRYNFFGEGDDAWTIGGAGRANWWLTPNISMQLDAQGEGSQIRFSGCSGPGCDFSTHDYLIAAHAMWRNSNYGLGVVGAVGDASPGFRFGAVGGEALVNWNMITLYLQGGYGSTIGSNEPLFADANTWFVRGTARYYPTQNLLLEGSVLGARTNVSPFLFDPSFDVDTLMWRVKAETMFNPWMSVYLAYQGSRSNFPAGFGCCGPDANDSVTDQRLTIGLRAWLNRDNLRNNDITGAPLDFINPFSLLGFGGQQMGSFTISDVRLKRDITLVGRLDDGLGLYRYRYLWNDTVYVGVMAQEVALIHPDAVVHGFDGYLRVNYGRLGLKLMTLSEWDALSKGERL